MPYLIETWDKPGHLPLRQKHRPAHLDFLESHKDLLLACGAKLTEAGSDAGGGIYIVALDSRAEAEAFIAQDPFFAAGLFDKIAFTNWRKAYVDGQCHL